MAKFIRGDAVPNATSYELHEKNGDGSYTKLAEKDVIDFEVSAMDFEEGDHTLVVKAKADGYEDSDYSNEVVYTAPYVDNNLMALTARLDENTVFVSGTNDPENWGSFKNAVVTVEEDYVKLESGETASSLWGIRKGVPTNIPEGTAKVTVSVYVRTDDTSWYEDQWFRLYGNASSFVNTFKPTTEWTKIESTWVWDGTWDRMQISSPTTAKTGVLYVKDFSLVVAE